MRLYLVPAGASPEVQGSSYLYFLLELKEVPFKTRGTIGPLYLFVGLFVLLLSSGFVVGAFDLSTLQTKAVSLISIVELYTGSQQTVFGFGVVFPTDPCIWSLLPCDP